MSVILEQAAAAVSDLLRAHAHALAAPVQARFRDTAQGTTGVAITVRLRDPARAPSAHAAIVERFGGAGVDVIDVR